MKVNIDPITLTIIGTVGSVALSLIAFFLNKILEDNKEAHREFYGDIKELRYDLAKMNAELAKIGLVEKQAITQEDKNSQEKKMRNSIAQVNRKVQTLKEDVIQVKNIVQPESVDGMIIYEPIPVYLARLSRKQEEQDQINNNTVTVLQKHNESLVKLKANQIKIVEAVKKVITETGRKGGEPNE